MMPLVNKVAVLDCIGFDLASRENAMQVRFAKCLVDEHGTVERQWDGEALLCHRVTVNRGTDIDWLMAMECRQIAALGYDPPTPEMIERVKAHCALEWGAMTIEPLALPFPEPMEFVPFDVMQKVKVN